MFYISIIIKYFYWFSRLEVKVGCVWHMNCPRKWADVCRLLEWSATRLDQSVTTSYTSADTLTCKQPAIPQTNQTLCECAVDTAVFKIWTGYRWMWLTLSTDWNFCTNNVWHDVQFSHCCCLVILFFHVFLHVFIFFIFYSSVLFCLLL